MVRPIIVVRHRKLAPGKVAVETIAHALSPCIFCGFLTAWKRPTPAQNDQPVCFDCIKMCSQLWEFMGVPEPEGD